jgi:hypothetical protein
MHNLFIKKRQATEAACLRRNQPTVNVSYLKIHQQGVGSGFGLT